MVLRRRGVSPVISTVILLSILLTLSVAALYYVSVATMRAEASGEATSAKESLLTLARRIDGLAGVRGRTYETVIPTRYGAVNIADTGLTMSVSFDGIPLGSYSVYTISYSVSQSFYSQSPEDVYGSGDLVTEGGVVSHMYTETAEGMWRAVVDTARVSVTFLYTESLPSGTRSVYAVDIVVLTKGTVSGTSAAQSVRVRLRVTSVDSYSLVDVSTLEVSLDSSSATYSFNTPSLVIVTVTTISVDITGGGGG